MFNELKRLFPYVGGHHDRLAGQSYIVKHGDINANVTVSLNFASLEVYKASSFSSANTYGFVS